MRFSLSVPWILAQLGVRKWLKDRALHLPDGVLPLAADMAGVTPEQWRRVEAAQAALVYGAVLQR